MVNVDVLHYLASKGYILLYEKYVALCQNFFFRLWLHAVQRKCIVFLCINFCHEYENILYIHIYFPHILFKFQVFSCTSQSQYTSECFQRSWVLSIICLFLFPPLVVHALRMPYHAIKLSHAQLTCMFNICTHIDTCPT